MSVLKKIMIVFVMIAFSFMIGCSKENEQEEGYYLPKESSILEKLGNNFAFELSYKGEGGDYYSEYMKTSEGYFYYYKSETEEYAYLYTMYNDSHYSGTKKELNKLENGYMDLSNSDFNEMLFFADTLVEKESEAIIGGRECTKYKVISEAMYDYSCYIDNETGACLRCVAKSGNSYYEWQVDNLQIGNNTLAEYILIAK